MRPGRNPSVWRDLGLAVALAATSGVIAARFDLHESVFSWTRRWEWLQLDEFPVALLVFALCLAVMNARRLMDLRGLLRENRLLAQRALAVQEAERKHLARELHDELGQYLNAIKLDSQAIPAERPAEPVLAAAQRIAANADHVYATVGNMIRRLRPAGPWRNAGSGALPNRAGSSDELRAPRRGFMGQRAVAARGGRRNRSDGGRQWQGHGPGTAGQPGPWPGWYPRTC